MAEIFPERHASVPAATPVPSSASAPTKQSKASLHRQALNETYALPAPIRTIPLPAFHPSNPISLLHLVYTWTRQLLFSPREPSVIHVGLWSPETKSVHITDETSMQALWEQGFYGKGNLSRSEPNWLKGQEVKLGLRQEHVSEIHTVMRRKEREQMKWERARAEQEVIRQVRLREARERLENLAPVGPLELLAMPNSYADRDYRLRELMNGHMNGGIVSNTSLSPFITGPVRTETFKTDDTPQEMTNKDALVNGSCVTNSSVTRIDGTVGMNGHPPNGIRKSSSPPAINRIGDDSPPLSRRKSVRFSPKVESTTFRHSDPPSPSHVASTTGSNDGRVLEDEGSKVDADIDSVSGHDSAQNTAIRQPLVNKEHLQLTTEEAFFLTFGFGSLSIIDKHTGSPLSTGELFQIFRQFSYFPPRIEDNDGELQPDDKFLLHYSVYHHYRSLGWVPRAGVKFGVDWLLYVRGPVFDHAEYGLIIIPSYSNPWWKENGKSTPPKTWPWFHGVNRTLAHALKTLLLVYVEVPSPVEFDRARERGIATVFRLYRVREFVARRWSINRR